MTLLARQLFPLCLLALAACNANPKLEGKRLTLENTSGRGDRVNFGGSLEPWRWAPDGVHLIRGRGKEERWFLPNGQDECSTPPSEEASAPVPLPTRFLSSPEQDPNYQVLGKARDSKRSLCLFDGELYLLDQAGKTPKFTVLTKASTPKLELAELSPDGTRVAFVQGNNLILLDCDGADRRALTSDGSPNVFNGKLDWVYQEEIYGRGNFKAFWWSPDSKRIAFLRLDEAKVYPFTVVDHIEEGHFRVKPEETKYPKPGDPNPSVRLGIADAAKPSNVRWVELDAQGAPEPLVTRVMWSQNGDRLLYMVQNRIQTWLKFNSVDPVSTTGVALITETSESWARRNSPPHWLPDGSFLWLSERSGQRHIYHYAAHGALIRQVTEGDWSVGSIAHVDPVRGIWFSASKDGAINANTYRVQLDGSDLMRLTHGPGSHRVAFNGDRSAFLDRSSSLAQAASIRLCDGEGTPLRILAESDMADFDAFATSPWELHEVSCRDGFPLDVALLKPVGFDPSKRYPVWVPTYSGPNAPSVRNRWNASSWFQFLAQNGVIVMQVNVRTASGKGLASTAQCYKQLGVQELKDLQDAVGWLTKNSYADEERVGITGHSYGGFMSAYALTHSDSFALGIASSGVYDWGMYDSIYTERYMQTPLLNPEGYAATSVINAAAELSGHLWITHGLMDDNVHFQNAVQLIYALQKAEKDFEVMLYPQSRHGIRHPALRWQARRLEWTAIQKHLLDR